MDPDTLTQSVSVIAPNPPQIFDGESTSDQDIVKANDGIKQGLRSKCVLDQARSNENLLVWTQEEGLEQGARVKSEGKLGIIYMEVDGTFNIEFDDGNRKFQVPKDQIEQIILTETWIRNEKEEEKFKVAR